MESILPFGFLSAAFISILAAVFIGAFWVGWGLQWTGGKKKDARSQMDHSTAVREGKDDPSAGMARAPRAREKKNAPAEMAPVPPAREEEKDTLAMDLCAPAVEGEKKYYESVEEVGTALVAGEESGVTVQEVALTTGNISKADGTVRPEEAENLKIGELKTEKKDGRPDISFSAAEREKEDSSAQIAAPPSANENKNTLTEMAQVPAAREEEKDEIAVDVAPAVEGEKKGRESADEVGIALPVGEERSVSVEAIALATGNDKADGPKRSEAAVNLDIGELTVEEKDARPDMPPSMAEREGEADTSAAIAPVPVLKIGELTLEELKAYDGSDAERPLLMAIRGQIYDVSKSRSLYGPGCHYELFGGSDVTRALALMSFDPEDLTGEIDDLKKADLEVLADWEQKYMEKYPRVGRLVATKSCDGKHH